MCICGSLGCTLKNEKLKQKDSFHYFLRHHLQKGSIIPQLDGMSHKHVHLQWLNYHKRYRIKKIKTVQRFQSS